MTEKDTFSEKIVFRVVTGLSAFVLLLILILNRKIFPVPHPVPYFVRWLPVLNAMLNGACSVLLLTSLYFIKRKQIEIHKRLNLLTFFLSSMFLVSYIMYHFFAQESHYPRDNPLRPLYLFILSTHIVLAGAVLPLILLAFYYGLRMEIEKHRKLVRYTFPIWLYVTVTGVIVYLMISPYYTFS